MIALILNFKKFKCHMPEISTIWKAEVGRFLFEASMQKNWRGSISKIT
jgi:hypothetical protein